MRITVYYEIGNKDKLLRIPINIYTKYEYEYKKIADKHVTALSSFWWLNLGNFDALKLLTSYKYLKAR